MKFETVLEEWENLYRFHFKVPDDIIAHYKKEKVSRFIFTIKGKGDFRGAFISAKENGYFIMAGKPLRKKYDLRLGDIIKISIRPDQSEYGMEVPSEFQEFLSQDEEGSKYFEALTPGKKRSLIYLVAKIKSSDKRIEKSYVILDHLKANKGVLDYKMLNQAFKDFKNHQF